MSKYTPANAIADLDACGWTSVADDLREGVNPETILKRLYEIDESDSKAYEIVAAIS